ncbi:hypothetical protein DSO57_1015542 [Entomophthora muscae]|uniref:Uncharacterized protein n=1 Tax=Entomophthora muscae TaxID=34485 RepID=A0ACC2S743_9FUNG|nr:hypothetical protein DSO57_1015542 [Entomophthora muscae]
MVWRPPRAHYGSLFGGNALMELQKLLDERFFVDKNGIPYATSASWVISAAFLSSPLRGTHTTFLLGATPGSPEKIHPFSLGRALYFSTQLWEWLDWEDGGKGWLGIHFRMSHFGIARNRSLLSFVKGLFSSDLFDNGIDNSSADASLVKYAQSPYKTFSTTFYRSYATIMTREDSNGREVPIPHILPFLSTLSGYIGSYDFEKNGNGLLDACIPRQSGWHKNDGVCPLISQIHPQDCDPAHCTHFELPTPYKSQTPTLPESLVKGHWYSSTILDCSHVDLIPGVDFPSLPKVLLGAKDFISWASKILNPFPDFDEKALAPVPEYWLPHYRDAFMTDYTLFVARVNASLGNR